MSVQAELKKIYLKDGAHIGYLLSHLIINNKTIDIEKAPLFKTQVEANNYIRQLQEKENKLNSKKEPPKPEYKFKNPMDAFEDLFKNYK